MMRRWLFWATVALNVVFIGWILSGMYSVWQYHSQRLQVVFLVDVFWFVVQVVFFGAQAWLANNLLEKRICYAGLWSPVIVVLLICVLGFAGLR